MGITITVYIIITKSLLFQLLKFTIVMTRYATITPGATDTSKLSKMRNQSKPHTRQDPDPTGEDH